MGLHRAGFDVVGVDIRPQPRYPFPFVQADALRPPFDLARFDFIWASPPCQVFTSAGGHQRALGRKYPNLIQSTRELLEASGKLFVMENVPQAPIRPDVVLSGPMFLGLRVVRKRHFETNFYVMTIGPRQSKSFLREGFVSVCGKGTPSWILKAGLPSASTASWRDAMGIDWMTRKELSQAIPPAYSEYIGRAALAYLQQREAA